MGHPFGIRELLNVRKIPTHLVTRSEVFCVAVRETHREETHSGENCFVFFFLHRKEETEFFLYME